MSLLSGWSTTVRGSRPTISLVSSNAISASDRVPTRKLGTGLGLAIVAELTEAMGSRCTAESPVADGRGTRMTVWLEPKSAPAAIPEDALLPNEDRPGG